MEQSLDRERKSRYQLTVLAIDQGSPPRTGSATVRITVLDQNDNPPSCISRVSADVRETAPLSQVVASLTCSDDDEAVNAVSTYQITPKGMHRRDTNVTRLVKGVLTSDSSIFGISF